MMGLHTPELIIIIFMILLLFGGKKLPELARSMGLAVQEYTRVTKGPVKYIESKTMDEKDEERGAILKAARKMDIKTTGNDISEISQDIPRTADQKED
ncbi:MAG: twin-arginine translocase TatA/TatE family subunit [Candidatus Bathyarchaeota archaeon]|jgi:sec-independent protein translocase protein TatA|nr:twin-arginine translocase TatA/TatE family subunit [Candidatus Bathyarchaeota archaeon]|tara:strand:- start:34 stop:327 length:294 start_codon:yes stop_codon:yes gene_type:complete